jgi:amino acid adenylation domain-containing protein/non-ribosomal peptide synthase protein (TIGR01720 family)
VKLADKTHGIDVWSAKLASHHPQGQRDYWISRLSAAVPALPVDGAVPVADLYGESEQLRIEFDAAFTNALLNECHHAYRTRINDLLMSALFLAVHEWTGQSALRIGLEGHGREEIFEGMDVSQTVGWFTSLFPLTLRMPADWNSRGESSLRELIRCAKDELRTLPDNGIGYGVLRYLARDEALLVLEEPTDILFNYLGQFDSMLRGAGSFAAAPEYTGRDGGMNLRRTHKLLVNSVVTDGRLSFDINFNPGIHTRVTVENFARGMEQGLRRIVGHCREQQRTRFSPSDFPLVRLRQGEIDDLQERYPRLADCHAASDLQSGLIFHALTDEGDDGEDYTVQVCLTFEAAIDVARFKNAWDRVTARHDCLRSAFTGFERDQILQVVLDAVELPWTEFDWRDRSDVELLEAFDAHARGERRAGFDFAHAPLMRFTLIRERDARYRFLWTHHHTLLDGWSLGAVLAEVVGFYSGLPTAGSTTGAYKDYLAWLQSRDQEQAREFWTRELQAVDRRAPLGIRAPVEAVEVRTRVKSRQLSKKHTRALEALARRHKVTTNVVVLACWAYLVSRHSGSNYVVVGQTVSGRDPAVRHVEDIVGLLIRTIPACIEVDGDLPIGEWLGRLHARSVERERYSYYPLPDIRRCSRLSAAEALFESLVVFENYPVDDVLKDAARQEGNSRNANARLPIGQTSTHDTTNYDLTLLVTPASELGLKLSYRAGRFAPEAIDQLMRHLLLVLEGIASGQCSLVRQLPLLSAPERQRLLGWNATQREYPEEQCIHEMFEEQVERAPDAIALVHEGQSLTYRQLNGRANILARRLKMLGAGPDQLVALCAERGVEMVVGILGILKSGAAYVPLDPNYPIERLRYMVEDAAPRVVLTQEKLRDLLPRTEAALLLLDGPQEQDAPRDDRNLPKGELGLTAWHLLFVIYTSGSTGRPKGTAMPHRAMINLIDWHRRTFAIDAGARVLQFAALSFDASFHEIFSTLGAGGTLVLIDEWIRRDAAALLDLVRSQSVQHMFVPPLMLQGLAESFRSRDPGPLQLKDVITAGEQLRVSPEIVEFFRRIPRCRLHNHYGPTETHVVTALTLQGDAGSWPALPTIGRPIANTQIHILAADRQLVPPGVTGEIFIGGANVARGYLGRPGLTAERFVRDPFSADSGARLYKTGDLGRWLEDGTIEFLGRNDEQVKIRGFRVELGEIEAQLARQARVREAAVVAREEISGGKRLVAYVTLREGAVGVEELREHLKGALPEHMVPSAFVILDNLPLTPSGKLDRRALPAPELAAFATREYLPPQGETEESLARIWRDVLRVQQVGRHDNFFDLGGHSLLATQLATRIRQTLSVELPVRKVFEHATLSSQALAVERARDAGAQTEAPMAAVSRAEPLPLSFAQQRMLFLEELLK